MNRIFWVLAMVLVAQFSAAQKINDELWPDRYNKKYLEHLIKIKVDSVRNVHGLQPLVNDSILYVAAQYHAEYLRKNNRFSHYEDDVPKMRTPQMRIDSFGAKHVLAGENLVESSIQVPVRNKDGSEIICKTYQQIAWHLVDLWVHSPGHFKNIITPEWDITGVAIAMDTTKGLVIAAQKFGNVMFEYSFNENKEFFNYSNYSPPKHVSSFSEVDSHLIDRVQAFGTKPLFVTPKAINTANIIENRKYVIETYTAGKKHGIDTWSSEMLYDFLKTNRKNGLALEFVPFEPYDCGNSAYYTQPSRRNRQQIYSGSITKPIYRKDLLKGFKKNKHSWFFQAYSKSDRDRFKMTLGKTPEDLQTIYAEQNILFFYKKQLIRVMHLTEYCGDGDLNFDLGTLNKDFLRINPKGYNLPAFEDKIITFEIPFERGAVDFTGDNANPILDSIRLKFTRIDRLEISAFSSLEGSAEVNARLQQSRAENIRKLILESQSEKEFPFVINVHENWPKMYLQMHDSVGLEHWIGWEKAQILKEINTHADSLETFLKEQRKALITIEGVMKLSLEDSLRILATAYDSILAIEDNAQRQLFDARLSSIYATHARLVGFTKEKMLPIAENYKQYPIYWETIFWTEFIDQVKDWSNQEAVKKVSDELGAMFRKNKDQASAYNYIQFQLKLNPENFKVNHDQLWTDWKSVSLDYVWGFDIKKSHLDSVRYLLHIKRAEQLFKEERPDFRESVDEIFKYYKAHPEVVKTEGEALNLAGVFLKYDDQPYAHAVLEPWADSTHLDALMLFAKLNYHHVEEYPESKYFDWLIEIEQYLPQEDWCGLFIGPCNIPFQVFDYEPLRNEYCEKCAEYQNYVQQLFEEQKNEVD